jgi:hypothetical protein
MLALPATIPHLIAGAIHFSASTLGLEQRKVIFRAHDGKGKFGKGTEQGKCITGRGKIGGNGFLSGGLCGIMAVTEVSKTQSECLRARTRPLSFILTRLVGDLLQEWNFRALGRTHSTGVGAGSPHLAEDSPGQLQGSLAPWPWHQLGSLSYLFISGPTS